MAPAFSKKSIYEGSSSDDKRSKKSTPSFFKSLSGRSMKKQYDLQEESEKRYVSLNRRGSSSQPRPRSGSFLAPNEQPMALYQQQNALTRYVPSSTDSDYDKPRVSTIPAKKKKLNRFSAKYLKSLFDSSDDSDVKKPKKPTKAKVTVPKQKYSKPASGKQVWETSSDSDDNINDTISKRHCRVLYVDENKFSTIVSRVLKLKPTKPNKQEKNPRYDEYLADYWTQVKSHLQKNGQEIILENLSGLVEYFSQRFQRFGRKVMLLVEINKDNVKSKIQKQYPFATKRVFRVDQKMSSADVNLLMSTLYWLIAGSRVWATFTLTVDDQMAMKYHMSGNAMRAPLKFLRQYQWNDASHYAFPEHDLFANSDPSHTDTDSDSDY